MPTLSDKAIQLDIKAYIVDNNIRRSVLTTRSVALSTDANIAQNTVVVGPGDNFVVPVVVNNSFTFLKTDKPVQISVTNANGSFSTKTTNIFAISDRIVSMLVQNASTTASAEIFIIQT